MMSNAGRWGKRRFKVRAVLVILIMAHLTTSLS